MNELLHRLALLHAEMVAGHPPEARFEPKLRRQPDRVLVSAGAVRFAFLPDAAREMSALLATFGAAAKEFTDDLRQAADKCA